MSDRTKVVLTDWVKFLTPLVVAGLGVWIAHVRAVDFLTAQDTKMAETLVVLSRRVDTLDAQGSRPLLTLTAEQRTLETRVSAAETTMAANAAILNDVRADLRVVAEWVREQRSRATKTTTNTAQQQYAPF